MQTSNLYDPSLTPTALLSLRSTDALGRRIQRIKGTGWIKYVYDGADVVRDISSDNSTVDYLNGLGVDDKIRQSSSSATLYFSKDHLGSTRALTDTSGNVVESVSYDSFGNGSSSLTRYGYTGREWDSDSNLYYYRNRWYDPQVGRFISEDPIGLKGGINLFAYVRNNPTWLVDPKGTNYSDSFMPTKAELDAARAEQAKQPMYHDDYNWWGTLLSEFNHRTVACMTDLFYAPSEILADPGVQFALISMGLPYGSPFRLKGMLLSPETSQLVDCCSQTRT